MNIATLLSQGGDSRITIDLASGLNQYFCPPQPSAAITCLGSCTASPISEAGFAAAISAHHRLADDPAAIAAESDSVSRRLLDHWGAADLAKALLAPSGTDATLLLMGLLAAETPRIPLVSILAAASETGSGVPWAASGRHFSTLTPLGEAVAKGGLIKGFSPANLAMTVALRHPDGTPRRPADVDQAFDVAVRNAPGRPILHLIDGSKTGLNTLHRVPSGAEVIVDACQARLDGARVRSYLDRGWPVLITGSKFYGGPTFSGAVLFPKSRWSSRHEFQLPAGVAAYAANRSTLLRWNAALAEMDRFAAFPAAEAARRTRILSGAARQRLCVLPGVTLLPAPIPDGEGWSAQQTIISFVVRDARAPARLMGLRDLRHIHQTLARSGILIGQPVEISDHCAVLRLAIGARDILDPNAEASLDRVCAALETLIASDFCCDTGQRIPLYADAIHAE
jgi:hypothetical protein